MYDNLFNSGGSQQLSLKAVMAHSGTSRQYRRRCLKKVRQAVRSGKKAVQEIAPKLLLMISDARMLRESWNDLAKRDRTTSGTGRLSFDYLDSKETWELLTMVGKAIRLGNFVPGPLRKRAIPKDRFDPSRGTRTITESNPEDRAVERSISLVLAPLIEARFPVGIVGFRKGKDRVDALALAFKVAQEQERFTWVTEDIRDAFDNVPRKELMSIVAKYVPSPELVALIKRFVFREPGNRGISQGGPLSPMLLNLYVFHFLEHVWTEKGAPSVSIIRSADDLLLLCQNTDEAEKAWTALNDLLAKAGLPLKHGQGKAIVDLSPGNSVSWLGYRIFRSGKLLQAKIAKKSWQRLRHHLDLAHEKPDSPLRAIDAIHGWIDQLGPCYESVNLSRELARIETVAREHGFDELPSRDALRYRWLLAHLRWKKRFQADVPQSPPSEVSIDAGLCVDGAWSRKRRKMEFRGIWLQDDSEAFRSGPIKTGSNNLAEFFAIVRGLRLLTSQGFQAPLFSDSQTAITWVMDRQIRCDYANKGWLDSRVYRRLTRDLLWLDRNRPPNPIVKWDKWLWGEIPADYGRK